MHFDDKYLDRITSQHKTKPLYMAWVAALLEKVQDLIDLLELIDAAFDLDDAVGAQLDTLGEFVGVKRLLNFEPIYAPSALLTDEDYRTIIKARISLNNWDGTTAGIYDLWSEVFPEATIEVVDNQDMTMSIRVYGLYSRFVAEYISHGYAAPKPQGVGLNYDFIFTIDLQSRLFIGAKVANTRSRFTLSSRVMSEALTVTGDVYAGGAVANMRTWFTLPPHNSLDELALEGNVHAGAFVANTRSRFILGSPEPDIRKELE